MKKKLYYFLKKYEPLFTKGGRFEQMAPAYNAFYTFLFTPEYTTQKGAHIRSAVDLKRVMIIVVMALIPALIFGIWNTGHQYYIQAVEAGLEQNVTWLDEFLLGLKKVLPLIIVSYVVGLGIEFYFAIKRGHEVNEGYLVTGMLIPLIMPVEIPLWILAVSVAFAVIFGKEVFGGTGMNIVNPALVARAFAFFAYPSTMSGNQVWVPFADKYDAISGETILGMLAQGKQVPWSWWDMFVGTIPGSVGETSFLMIMSGALLLLFTKVGSWRIMIPGFLGGIFMGLLFNLWGANALMQFPWWQHLLVGGFAFGIVFMATDPVTAAQTRLGKIIYGFLIGMFAILIRVLNPAYPEGMMLAILLMNVVAPTIDYFVVEANVKKRMKRKLKLNKQTA